MSNTGLWVIVFFIAIVFFIIICQSGKICGGTRKKLPGSSFTVGRPPPPSEDKPKTTIFVQPIGEPPIAVEMPADATTEDLVRQTQVQLNRRINLLTFQDRPIEHGVTLADQGIGMEALVTEIMGTSTIRFNTSRDSISLNTVLGRGKFAGTLDLYIQEDRFNYSIIKASLRIPVDCIEDPEAILQMGWNWKSTRNEPRDIKLKRNCDLNRIYIIKSFHEYPYFDPNTVSNLVFGAPQQVKYPNLQWNALWLRD
jgi:hypothetical protein